MIFTKFATRTLAYLYGERRQQISGLLCHLMGENSERSVLMSTTLSAGPLLSTVVPGTGSHSCQDSCQTASLTLTTNNQNHK